jgi:hypothetical protein
MPDAPKKSLAAELRELAEASRDTGISRSALADGLLALAERAEREEKFLEAAKALARKMDEVFPTMADRAGAEEGDLIAFAMLDAWRALISEEAK